MKTRAFALLLLTSATAFHTANANAAPADWVERSNGYTKPALETEARFAPEAFGQQGVAGVDELIVDLKPGVQERYREALQGLVHDLKRQRDAEADATVRQDIEILIKAEQLNIKGSVIDEQYALPYFNVPRIVFTGILALLDDRIAPARRKAALVRLRRYVGAEAGYPPILQLAEARTREHLDQPALYFPARVEVERNLADQGFLLDGIGKLFMKYKIAGFARDLATFRKQTASYEQFVRKEILPRSREDFRLPAKEYEFLLERNGVDMAPAQLIVLAHHAFADLQAEMQMLAPVVARDHRLEVTGYRDVIKALKKDQIIGADILPQYEARLKEIENVIRGQDLVTLPARAARIRIASDAETAAQPAPHMSPPPLVGNSGEQGDFVLPLNRPAAPGASTEAGKYDDFAFAAASWALISHEARPGHELQFDAMVEHGVSTARAIFAANNTNVEGWGLYAEAIMLPYMPPDGQLISLQLRLLRAARAFLDPELQAGTVTPAQAKSLLMDDVGLSNAFADEEVERFTFRSPGQATSYYYGYVRLMQLRSEVEKLLGAKFNQRRFHDFILGQGLLPPDMLREAVLRDFVPAAPANHG
jgi:hypothetical protein